MRPGNNSFITKVEQEIAKRFLAGEIKVILRAAGASGGGEAFFLYRFRRIQRSWFKPQFSFLPSRCSRIVEFWLKRFCTYPGG
jgi:hypothetical protein